MASWAERFAAEGRDLLVESCGNGPEGTNPKKDPTPMQPWVDMLEDSCPFSFYRVSIDVAPQWESTIFNANRAVPYLGAQPLSRQGCYAYPDMVRRARIEPHGPRHCRRRALERAVLSDPVGGWRGTAVPPRVAESLRAVGDN